MIDTVQRSLRALLAFFSTSTHWFATLVRYGSVGGITLCFDLTAYWIALAAHVSAVTSAMIGGVFATLVHFVLSKFFTFQNSERRYAQQVIIYLVLGAIWWSVTLGIISTGVHYGLNPLIAKLIAIAINFPFGFLAHRYITFGDGVDRFAAAIRRAFISSARS